MAQLRDVNETLETHDYGVVTGFTPSAHRLSARTRELASRFISGEIGRASLVPADFCIDPVFYRPLPSPNQEVAEAVRLIAEHAPLRILPEELLVGAATLAKATEHMVPLTNFFSVSHTTLGFEKALKVGIRGLLAEIQAALMREGLSAEALDNLHAMHVCLVALLSWHQRYVKALEALISTSNGDQQAHYQAVLDHLRNVPENPPANFREALQALWIIWNFLRLCGNWSGIGRIDTMLGPFLLADLENERLTLDDARELLAHFWIKGCEWITAEGRGSGDAQFYQNIVLAGIDETGRDITNPVTYLILDVVEELHISDFPIAVRLSANTPEKLLRRIAEVQRLGGGIVAVYNEERIIANLVDFGYPLEEARNFANDGCWEVLIPGKTFFCYQPFDLLQILQDTLGLQQAQPGDFPDFDALYSAFVDRLAMKVTELSRQSLMARHPSPLVSAFVEDCIARGRAYHDGGPKYTVHSPHAGGLPDVADSLLVIKTLVYDEGRVTLPELVKMLRENWQGHEDLRRYVRTHFTFFGNDAAAADAMVVRVFNDYTGLAGQVRERFGILRPAGMSTFGREVSDFLPQRNATASGHMQGDILAGNFSPSPGSDLQGPTAVVRSHCAADFSRLPGGTALDLKIMPSTLRGEEGLAALIGLMRTFIALGGIFMQIDVVDSALLREAQEHPERYPNLSVRVSGWSARFATLAREWQDMIIWRTEQKL